MTHTAMVISGIFLLQLLNPSNNSLVAAAASIGLNLAILSPVFWVPKTKLGPNTLKMVFMVLLAFHSCSVGLGILEVYLPGRFSRESQITASLNEDIAEGLKVTLSDGTKVYRPMGLTDSPGGAAVSGYLTVLLATGLLLFKPRLLYKIYLCACIPAGIFCLFICQVRSLLLITIVCELTIFSIVTMRGEFHRLATLLVLLPAAIVGGAAWAFFKGGDQVADRFSSLTESRFDEVYYSNRGIFLEDTFFNVLPQFPLGAGLGRWGMIHTYFGDKSSTAPFSLYAEIQSTAWIYDGGVLLMGLYYFVILFSIWNSAKTVFKSDGVVSDLATVVVGLNLATLATTFGSIPFIGQSGVVFWLLNTGLVAVGSGRKMTQSFEKAITRRRLSAKNFLKTRKDRPNENASQFT